LDNVVNDLFSQSGRWQDWRFTAAPAYFPDVVLYFISSVFLSDAVLRVLFVTVVQGIMLGMAVLWLAKILRPTVSPVAKCALLFLLSLTVVVSAHSGMWFLFNTTNNSFSALLFALIGAGLVFRYCQSEQKKYLGMLLTSGVVATLSSIVYTICFTLPVLCLLLAVFALLVRDKNQQHHIRTVSFLAGSIILVPASSAILDKFITYNAPLDGRLSITIAGARNSMKSLFDILSGVIAGGDVYFRFLGWLAIAAFVYVVFLIVRNIHLNDARSNIEDKTGISISFKLSSKDSRYLAVNIMLVSSVFILTMNLMGVVISGGLLDTYGYRYFLFPFALLFIISILFMDAWVERRNALDRYKIATLIIVAAVSIVFAVVGTNVYRQIKSSSGNTSLSSQIKEGNKDNKTDEIAMALTQLKNKGVPLNAGISQYWISRAVSYRLHWMPIFSTLNDLSPFYWMSTSGPFVNRKRYEDLKFNFVIMDKPAAVNTFNYSPETIGRVLPVDHVVYDFPDKDIEVWFYPNDDLDIAVRKNFGRLLFLNGASEYFELGAPQMLTLTGRLENNRMVARYDSDKAGFMVYGPYFDLSRSKYKAILKYKAIAGNDKEAIIAKWDVGRFSGVPNSKTLAQLNISGNGEGQLALQFEIEDTMFTQFESRVFYNGTGSIEIESLSITRIAE
jgi:hypothetical protein